MIAFHKFVAEWSISIGLFLERMHYQPSRHVGFIEKSWRRFCHTQLELLETMSGKILIVDDVVINTRLLTAKLRSEYYLTKSASDGYQAVELAVSWQPDVILLDIMMPGMHGYECCRRLKLDKLTNHIPIIVITALDGHSERLKGLEAGADEFLTKPINYSLLLVRIRALIYTKRLLDQWRARVGAVSMAGVDLGESEIWQSTSERILIIAQNVCDAAEISRELEHYKCQRLLFDSGNDQFELQSPYPDLLIFGPFKESLDYLSLISSVRAEAAYHQTPILLILDMVFDMDLLRKAIDLGASDWLQRPWDPLELRYRCGNWLNRSRYEKFLRWQVDRAIELVAIDPLTKLFNRRYFEKYANIVLEMERESTVSMLLIDIDHFKSINDRFGHQVGDLVIRYVSSTLNNSSRAFDVTARYGGEEFVLLLPSTDVDNAVALAEHILLAIRHAGCCICENIDQVITASIGVASRELGASSMEEFLGQADTALYLAKSRGRNRVEIGLPIVR